MKKIIFPETAAEKSNMGLRLKKSDRRKPSKRAMAQVRGGEHVTDEVVRSGKYFRQPGYRLKRSPQCVDNRAHWRPLSEQFSLSS